MIEADRSTRSGRSVVRWISFWLLGSCLLFAGGLWLGFKTVLPGPSSHLALSENHGEQLAIAAGIPPRDQVLVMLDHPSEDVSDIKFIQARDSLLSFLQGSKSATKNTAEQEKSALFLNVQTAGHNSLNDAIFTSADQRSLLFIAETDVSVDRSAQALALFPKEITEWLENFPDFKISYISKGLGDNEIFALINRDLDRSLIFTLPLSLLVLIWTFSSVVAALIPLLFALVSLGAALGVTAIFSTLVGPVSATASQLVVLLVLAIGVDYSLFIISRMREEVQSGRSYPEAITIARRTAGRAVVLSGLTVALSLSGLLLMQDTILTSMAAVSIAATIITVFSCVTILPLLLLILGPVIECGRIRRRIESRDESTIGGLLQLSISHPKSIMVVMGGLLLLFCYFSTRIHLGSTVQPQTLPYSLQLTQAFRKIQVAFPDLVGADLSVILRGADLSAREQDGTVPRFLKRISEISELRGPLRVDRSKDNSVVRYSFVVPGNINDAAAHKAVEDIRHIMIPELYDAAGVEATLSGTLPYAVDDDERYGKKTWRVYAAVLGLSMMFLLIAFRSIVVPLKAILLNLLSTGAAFGVMVLVFQEVFKRNVFDDLQYGVIESFVPALLFAILFGLSMDYHVFLLSRVREEVLSGKETDVAIKRALLTTSRTITSAALIMVSVFSIIATLELPVMKQLGIGLAVAVFLDATVVRSLLLPASLKLLGKWNWYLPRGLNWLPKISIHS